MPMGYVCVCVCVCIYVCMHVCMCVHVCVFVFMYVFLYVFTYVWMYACAYIVGSEGSGQGGEALRASNAITSDCVCCCFHGPQLGAG
jgi:hypothetical protein